MNLAKSAVHLAGTVLLAAGVTCSATAGIIVYNFDIFDDGTSLTTHYAGLSFSQSSVLKAGQSLNDSALPPHSADGVVFDDGGPISLIFSTPVYSVGGYFTYTSGLTVAIYDDIGTSLGVLTGPYVSNLADGSGDSGSAPNEFLQLPIR